MTNNSNYNDEDDGHYEYDDRRDYDGRGVNRDRPIIQFSNSTNRDYDSDGNEEREYSSNEEEDVYYYSDRYENLNNYPNIFDYYSSMEEYEGTIDQIFDEDQDHLDADRIHNAYYIGVTDETNTLLATTVSANTFLKVSTAQPATSGFKYKYHDILFYLLQYSVFYRCSPKIQIIQLHIDADRVYCPIIKTFWIRIIQRTWKKQYQKWKTETMSFTNIIRNSFRNTRASRPSLCGLLYEYNNVLPIL